MNKKLKDINELHETRDIRGMYEITRRERTGYQSRLHNIKDERGKMLTEEKEIVNRWKEYIFSRRDEEMEERAASNNTNNDHCDDEEERKRSA